MLRLSLFLFLGIFCYFPSYPSMRYASSHLASESRSCQRGTFRGAWPGTHLTSMTGAWREKGGGKTSARESRALPRAVSLGVGNFPEFRFKLGFVVFLRTGEHGHRFLEIKPSCGRVAGFRRLNPAQFPHQELADRHANQFRARGIQVVLENLVNPVQIRLWHIHCDYFRGSGPVLFDRIQVSFVGGLFKT